MVETEKRENQPPENIPQTNYENNSEHVENNNGGSVENDNNFHKVPIITDAGLQRSIQTRFETF